MREKNPEQKRFLMIDLSFRFVVTEALKFRVGFATGKMAQLWNEALLGMCQGEVADIDVTTEEIDSEHFPVGTEMKYTVEVDEVIVRGKERKPPLTIENFKLMDLDHDGILLKSEVGIAVLVFTYSSREDV